MDWGVGWSVQRCRSGSVQRCSSKPLQAHYDKPFCTVPAITPELYWGEGDYVSNLTVRGNDIANVCIGKQCYGGITLGAKGPSLTWAQGRSHHNVTITGNVLRNLSQMNLWASGTVGIVVENNTIVAPFAYAPVAMCCPPLPFPKNGNVVARIENLKEGRVVGNCVCGDVGQRLAVSSRVEYIGNRYR
jgi:hypothetical protein